jgi:hypothetical protein
MSQLTIDQVKEEFSAWRRNKNGQDKIPEELWRQVKILLKLYRHNEVLRQLKITKEQARNKKLLPSANTSGCLEKHTTSDPFVKIANTQPNVNSVTATTITLHRGEAQLLLSNPSDEQIQWLVNAFME